MSLSSLPSRGRGLKFYILQKVSCPGKVAPLAGAWIEMPVTGDNILDMCVAPLAGAWIEIEAGAPCTPIRNCRSPRGAWIEIDLRKVKVISGRASLPSRERGLK